VPVQQHTHHYVITLQVPARDGFRNGTWSGTFTPHPDETRADVYTALLADIANRTPEYRGSNVLFFSIEPNRL
jgi:hypothetical protein